MEINRYTIIIACDNFTTIGPDDQDFEPTNFLLTYTYLNKLCDSKEEKNEEIGQYFIFSKL